ncbi:MAG: phosphatase PAP2 family protein [Planctomycetota bacterium]|jgi:hypothetical protein
MKKTIILTLVLAMLLPSIMPQQVLAGDPDEDLEDFGDVMQILLPAAGAGLAVWEDDKEGQKMWLKALLTQIGTVSVMKFTVDKTRPIGGKHSYPSGHTAAAFMGASFLQRRYGWWWGAPAYGLAGVVGYSRMHADKHDWYDVPGGATIGIFSTYMWTKPYKVGDVAVKISPLIGRDYYGLDFNLTEADQYGNYATLFGGSSPFTFSTSSLTPTGQISTGTDPTEVRTRFDLSGTLVDQSQNVDLSARRTTGYSIDVLFDWAFAKNHQASVFAGWVRNHQEPYDGDGIGDTIFSYLWRFYMEPETEWWKPRAAALGADLLTPTGDGSDGTGNEIWAVHPVVYGSWTLVDNQWGMDGAVYFYPSVALYQSFDEDKGASSTTTLQKLK